VVVVAGLLVLTGLGLFVAGVLTAVPAWYWACVVVCALAAVLLVVARLRAPADTRVPAGRPESGPAPARSAAGATAVSARTSTATATAPTTTAPTTTPVAADEPAPREAAEEPAGRHGHDAEPGDGARSPEPPAPPVPASRPTTAASGNGTPAAADGGDPPEEDVEVTDLLMVVDLTDEVLVVDEHPRYHLAGCPWLAGRETIPLPVAEARTDGFTPCGRCGPDRSLSDAERARRAARRRG
jgi:hypothetical protein